MRTTIVASIIASTLLVPSLGLAATPPAPEGFSEESRTRLAPGVTHQVLKAAGEQSVNVAHIAPSADVDLQPVTSFNQITGGRLERTSSMCGRVDCIVAINGDFYGDGAPVGALAAGAELLRSQKGKHHLLMIGEDRALSAGTLGWTGKLVATDLSEVVIDGVNIPRRANELVLYTRPYARATGTNPHGAEMVIRFIKPDRRPRMDETAIVELEAFRYGKGDTTIPIDGAVLSGHGKQAEALRRMWNSMKRGDAGREALLRIDAKQDVLAAIGGSPILLRDGEVWFTNSSRAFVRSRAPRTLVGWNDAGEVWLVTVDGRQAGFARGMSLMEAALLMRSLGATDAINLDGGGSTTFVVDDTVANRPSDRLVRVGGTSRIAPVVAAGVDARNVERPVANALVVVPRTKHPAASSPPSLDVDVPSSKTVTAPAPAETDPASNPSAALPAILEPLATIGPAPARDGRGAIILLAVMLNLGAAALTLRHGRRWLLDWLPGV